MIPIALPAGKTAQDVIDGAKANGPSDEDNWLHIGGDFGAVDTGAGIVETLNLPPGNYAFACWQTGTTSGGDNGPPHAAQGHGHGVHGVLTTGVRSGSRGPPGLGLLHGWQRSVCCSCRAARNRGSRRRARTCTSCTSSSWRSPLPVFIAVEALLIWCIVRYRKRDDSSAAADRSAGSRSLGVFFAIPAVIVAVLFPFGETTLMRSRRRRRHRSRSTSRGSSGNGRSST